MAQGSDDISSPSLHFHEKCYTEVPKIESTLKVKEVVDYLKQKLSREELVWFTEHPQFRHIFHKHHEDNTIHMGWWLLLVRTADTSRKDECWFVVNGVPIRYSLREHALITGLSCHSLQPGYEHVSSPAFIERCMGSQEVNILDVHKRLDDMEQCDTNDDRLKMAVLYFLGSVLTGTKNKKTNLEKFLVNVVDDLALCRSFAWGSYTFFQCLENINKIIKDSKGIVKKRVVFPGFILGFEKMDANVTANCVHPGIVRTRLTRDREGLVTDLVFFLTSKLLKSVPQAAATTCYVATSPRLINVSGKYFLDCNEARASKFGSCNLKAQRLWTASELLVSKAASSPNVHQTFHSLVNDSLCKSQAMC